MDTATSSPNYQFWKILWSDGKTTKWSMRQWSLAALQMMENIVNVEAVES